MRRTRILATLGPASIEPPVLDALLAAGLDAVRLNFSHGAAAWHAETYRRVRDAAARQGREVAVLQDLQGPKIRLGKLRGTMSVAKGATLTITTRDVPGEDGVVPTDYDGLSGDVSPGTRILLDEGRVSVVVRAVDGPDVRCEVVDGGVLTSHKGLSVPNATLTAAPMTPKDEADLRFGLDLGVDHVALSFVRRAEDVESLRRLMRAHGREVPIVAKIERPQALDVLDEIVAVADGVMVARGDLAIEASLEMIPAYQKRIIQRANHAGKLVITATQMLESMTENPLPTRAEVTDVANAILDGTDAVMLSGETANGKYPVESVTRMASIAVATEESLFPFDRPVRRAPERTDGLDRVIAGVAAHAARDAGAIAIVVFTKSGDSAVALCDERPRAPILAFTREPATRRRLALHWGVEAIDQPPDLPVTGLMEAARRFVVGRLRGAPGDRVVFVLGAEIAEGIDHTVRIVEI